MLTLSLMMKQQTSFESSYSHHKKKSEMATKRATRDGAQYILRVWGKQREM